MIETLYFHCGVDCEPLAERSPACGGPASWKISEKAILKFVEIFEARGVLPGLAFNLTPEAAKAHSDLFRDLKRRGLEIAIQPNVPGFRFPTYKLDLGCYGRDQQKRIIGEALEDFEAALGFLPEVYLPCCGSMNEHTIPVLLEYGFKVLRNAAAGRYVSSRPDKCSVGRFPYPHWASEHPTIAGSLPLYVIPGTGDLTTVGRDQWVQDLRPENPPTHQTLSSFRRIVDMNIEVMWLIKAPVKAIIAGTHNTERVHFENMEYVIDYVREKARAEEMELVPISALGLRKVAEATGDPCVESKGA